MTSTIETDTTVSTAATWHVVGDPSQIALLIQPGHEMAHLATSPDDHLDLSSTVILVPRIPAGGDFTESTDQALEADLGGSLAELLASIQASLPSFADRPGHLIIVLPAEPALGQAGSAVPSAFCGAALSLARTLALELARENITVNTVLHGVPTPDIKAALAAQLLALGGSDAATGQEIYVTGGTDLGRLRP